MRHTYADTERARAELGFAPRVGSRGRTRGRIPLAFRKPGRQSASVHIHRDQNQLHVPSDDVACAHSSLSPPAAPPHRASRACGHDRAGQVPVRQGHRRPQQEKMADRARVLQAGHRDLHAERYRPDAKLGIGDTYLGEGTAESAGPRDQRVPRVPQLLPTHGRADYAQYKLGMSHFRQMRGRSAIRRKRAKPSASCRRFVDRFPTAV